MFSFLFFLFFLWWFTSSRMSRNQLPRGSSPHDATDINFHFSKPAVESSNFLGFSICTRVPWDHAKRINFIRLYDKFIPLLALHFVWHYRSVTYIGRNGQIHNKYTTIIDKYRLPRSDANQLRKLKCREK